MATLSRPTKQFWAHAEPDGRIVSGPFDRKITAQYDNKGHTRTSKMVRALECPGCGRHLIVPPDEVGEVHDPSLPRVRGRTSGAERDVTQSAMYE